MASTLVAIKLGFGFWVTLDLANNLNNVRSNVENQSTQGAIFILHKSVLRLF